MKSHKLGDVNNRDLLSQFWRLEVQHQYVVSKTHSTEDCEGRIVPQLSL